MKLVITEFNDRVSFLHAITGVGHVERRLRSSRREPGREANVRVLKATSSPRNRGSVSKPGPRFTE
jgi:hypothetical protein